MLDTGAGEKLIDRRFILLNAYKRIKHVRDQNEKRDKLSELGARILQVRVGALPGGNLKVQKLKLINTATNSF